MHINIENTAQTCFGTHVPPAQSTTCQV